MNHERHEIHESVLGKKYRFRVDYFRVVRVFRGKMFFRHRRQNARFVYSKQKEMNHERHEIHEKSLYSQEI